MANWDMQKMSQNSSKCKRNYITPRMRKVSLVRREHLLLNSITVLPIIIED